MMHSKIFNITCTLSLVSGNLKKWILGEQETNQILACALYLTASTIVWRNLFFTIMLPIQLYLQPIEQENGRITWEILRIQMFMDQERKTFILKSQTVLLQEQVKANLRYLGFGLFLGQQLKLKQIAQNKSWTKECTLNGQNYKQERCNGKKKLNWYRRWWGDDENCLFLATEIALFPKKTNYVLIRKATH